MTFMDEKQIKAGSLVFEYYECPKCHARKKKTLIETAVCWCDAARVTNKVGTKIVETLMRRVE